MTRTSKAVVLAATLVSFPLIGMAEGERRPDFKDVDSDGDRRITVEEAIDLGVPEAEAKREDIDNDGKLTRADWKFVDMDDPESDDGSGSGS